MSLVHMLAAASAVLSATAAAPRVMPAVHGASAYFAGAGRVGRGPQPGGRGGLRDGGPNPFAGATGAGGFGRWDPDHGWNGRGHRRWGPYAAAYPFWYGPYGDDGYGFDGAGGPGYGPEGGPGPFGAPPPYGGRFAEGFGPVARPPAEALAPLAYGPGPHDGAYAYGYNGYAQTPALPAVYGAAGWAGNAP